MKRLQAIFYILLVGGATASAQEAPGDVEPADVDPPEELNLQQCVGYALRQNLNLATTAIDNETSKLNVKSAKTAFYPVFRVDFSGFGPEDLGSRGYDLSVTQFTPLGTSFTLSGGYDWDNTGRDSRASISVSQPLLRGFGRADSGLALRGAHVDRRISLVELEIEVQRLVFQVKQAYYAVAQQEKTLNVRAAAVERAKKMLVNMRLKKKAGFETKLNVSRTEVQLAERQVSLATSRQAYESTLDRLKEILNLKLKKNYRVAQPAPARRVTLDLDKTVKLAHENRLEMLTTRRRVDLAKLRLLRRYNLSRHQLDLSASFDLTDSGLDFEDVSRLNDDHTVSVSLNYRWPWGRASDRIELEREKLAVRRQMISLERERVRIHREVRDVLRDLRSIALNLDAFKLKIQGAQSALEAAEALNEAGRGDIFAVIEANDDLLQAETDQIREQLNYLTKLAELDLVRGKRSDRVDLRAARLNGKVLTNREERLIERFVKSFDPKHAVGDLD